MLDFWDAERLFGLANRARGRSRACALSAIAAEAAVCTTGVLNNLREPCDSLPC